MIQEGKGLVYGAIVNKRPLIVALITYRVSLQGCDRPSFIIHVETLQYKVSTEFKVYFKN
ncbi:MAG: hypothetical protein RMY30_021695 [Nostoc sp. CmiSLP01]|nr:hypothetical protein [Nostoc sp. CmiSLP01]